MLLCSEFEGENQEALDGWRATARQLLRGAALYARQCIVAPAHFVRHVRRKIVLRFEEQPPASARKLPGFARQFYWCLGRAAVLRTRDPLSVFTDYAVFALTGTRSCHLHAIFCAN